MDADELTVVVLRDPTPRVPVPALSAPSVRGERVVCQDINDTHHWGYVAWSEVYAAPDGKAMVQVVDVEDWNEFKYLGRQPVPGVIYETDARAVWLE